MTAVSEHSHRIRPWVNRLISGTDDTRPMHYAYHYGCSRCNKAGYQNAMLTFLQHVPFDIYQPEGSDDPSHERMNN